MYQAKNLSLVKTLVKVFDMLWLCKNSSAVLKYLMDIPDWYTYYLYVFFFFCYIVVNLQEKEGLSFKFSSLYCSNQVQSKLSGSNQVRERGSQ